MNMSTVHILRLLPAFPGSVDQVDSIRIFYQLNGLCYFHG